MNSYIIFISYDNVTYVLLGFTLIFATKCNSEDIVSI
jgi:hypothetical protein